MPLSHVPLLQIQRDLYDLPRGWARFERYRELMTGGTQDVVLPLSVLNPMGKVHVAEALDALLELGAEAVAAQAVEEIAERLEYSANLRHGIVVADDAQGGWTERYLTEFSHRFGSRADIVRGWVVTLVWTSERVTQMNLREEVLAQIFRTSYQQHHGLPKTLAQHLTQEGLALTFAGTKPWLEADDLAYSLGVLESYTNTTDTPAIFACLYGDEAATSVGYPALGLSERAGFAVALASVLRKGSPGEILDYLSAESSSIQM